MSHNTDNPTTFDEHRTRAELADILHYGHWIPVCHGYTATAMARMYPGWTWNELTTILQLAGVVVYRPSGAPPTCHPDVVSMSFSHSGDWQVLWADGTGTEEHF